MNNQKEKIYVYTFIYPHSRIIIIYKLIIGFYILLFEHFQNLPVVFLWKYNIYLKYSFRIEK